MKIFLALFTFFIVYGSLYPFHIALSSDALSQWHALLNVDITQSGRGDTVANILLFVPFGFFCRHSYPAKNSILRFVHIMLAGLLLAFGLQVAQLVIPGRVPSGSDAVWNMLGCLIGYSLALLPLLHLLPKSKDAARFPPIPLILALSCIAYSWAPFVPSLDFQLLKDNLKFIFSPDISPWWLLQKFTLWLVIFRFLRSSDTWLSNEKLYPLIVVVVLSVNLFIVGHAPGAEHILGGLLALPAWYFLRPLRQASILAVLFAVSLLITTFVPFELHQDPNSFSWVPFSGALSSNILLNAMSIFRKLAYYASLIWLLAESGLHLRTSTVLVAAVLFFSEQLQVYFVGPSPEITDTVMAVAVGVILSHYQAIRRAELVGNQEVDSGSRTGTDTDKLTLSPKPDLNDKP